MPQEYEPTPIDIKKAELAKNFEYEKDLAFFVVQIGMNKSEFDSLTEKEKMFIRKEQENHFIHETTWMRNAVLNAEANINRKKNKRFIELFPIKQMADKEYNENAIQNVLAIEQEKGKSWVDRIYQANGMKKPILERKE